MFWLIVSQYVGAVFQCIDLCPSRPPEVLLDGYIFEVCGVVAVGTPGIEPVGAYALGLLVDGAVARCVSPSLLGYILPRLDKNLADTIIRKNPIRMLTTGGQK